MNTNKLGVTSVALSEGRFVLEDSKRVIVAARTSTKFDIKAGFLNFSIIINSKVDKESENCDVNVQANPDNNTIEINFINFIYPFYNSIETNNNMVLMDKFEVATAGNKIIYIELLISPIKDRNENSVIDFNIYSGDPADRIERTPNDEDTNETEAPAAVDENNEPVEVEVVSNSNEDV